ncbi:MAG: tetratricopeptide repeat protein [Anaerolineales bacterium]|nr:tetratricopeptide repeat protein [Anaerolineales bacterium]
MECPQCHAQNPDQAKFCLECGSKLILACPQCGAALPPQAKFCFECGAKIAPPPPAAEPPVEKPPEPAPVIPPPQPAPVSQAAPPVIAPLPAADLPADISYLYTFLPRARLAALASGQSLPPTARGVAMFADISGFTPLTEALRKNTKGTSQAQYGAERLTEIINAVFEALIAQVHGFGGDVLGFAGDAITCWFDEASLPIPGMDTALTAVHCALAMQQTMTAFSAITTPGFGEAALPSTHALTIKIGLAGGETRRLTVGDPAFGRFDLMTGAPMSRVAAAEHHAKQSEIICAPELVERLGAAVTWGENREGFRPLAGWADPTASIAPPLPPSAHPELPGDTAARLETLRPYFPPALFEWLLGTQGSLLAELRPVVNVFLRFEGLDFEGDAEIETKLDTYVRLVQSLAGRFGGSLIRLDYGDKGSVMHVVFGAPTAHADDELRAVGWALELQAATRELPYITNQLIGMTRGQVYAGALGASTRRGYTLMGDEINASARLMMACQPGQALVSQSIMQAAQKRFMFHQFPGYQVKGKFEPVPVAMPVAPLPPMQQFVPPRPIVGREAELAMLDETLTQTSTGLGQALRIEGVEGVGKSRLAAELVQRAMGRGFRTLTGSGQSSGRATAYLPWRDIFMALFGLQSAWPAAQQAMQIQTMLQWINPEWIPRLPLLGDLLGLSIPETPLTASLDARLRQQSLFALVGDLLKRMASQQPLLVLIEDCHWMDEASSALVESIGLGLSGPLLLVVTHRPPEPGAAILPGLDAAPRCQSLHLEELPQEAVSRLVQGYLGGELPGELMELIQERSQGNPLFVEELSETLREVGRLQNVEGRWRLVGIDRAALKLPDTVQGVVLARLDRLVETEKFVLKVASVLGKAFEAPALAQVHPIKPAIADLQAQLARLEQREFIFPEDHADRLAWRFRQNLTQEVAYSTLLFSQRRQLHQAAAEWYESALSQSLSPHYPLLAHHYQQAEIPEKERHYVHLAGEQAAAQFANNDALRYLGRALELTPTDDLASRYNLLLACEKILDLQGKRSDQKQHLDELQTLAGSLQDPARQAAVRLRLASLAEVTGDYPAAVAELEQALALTTDPAAQAAAHQQWGRVLWQQSSFDEALLHLNQALQLAQGQPRLVADIQLNLGILALRRADYPSARLSYEQARAAFAGLGDRLGESKALLNLGNVHNRLGEIDLSNACYQQALELKRQIGDLLGEANALMNLGNNHQRRGAYDHALSAFQQALEIYQRVGHRRNQANVLINMGNALLALGAYPDSRQRFSAAYDLLLALGDRKMLVFLLSNQALLDHLTGDQPAAIEHSQQAADIARQLKLPSVEAEALTHLGHALGGLERWGEALEAYQVALEIRRRIGETNMAIESQAGLARAALALGDQTLALEHARLIMAHLQSANLDGVEEPLRVHLTCFQALKAAGDPAALQILEDARRLLDTQAAQIGDENLRRSFLENVPAHREIALACQG